MQKPPPVTQASMLGTHTQAAVERKFLSDQKNTEVYETLKQLLEENDFFDTMERRINDLEENFLGLEENFLGLEGNIYTKIADDFQTKIQELDFMIESKIKAELELFGNPDGGSSITLVRGAGATTSQEQPGVGGGTAKSKKKKRKKTKKKKKQTKKSKK